MTRRELENRKNVFMLQLELMRREEKALIEQFGKEGYHQRIDTALDGLYEIIQRILELNKTKKDDEAEL